MQKMENENNTETQVIQHGSDYTEKKYCYLLRTKNGICPWKETVEVKNKLEANEVDQQPFNEENEISPPLASQETTQSLSPSREDSAEEFKTELTFFNDLVFTNDPVSHIEYLPYYRTYTNLVEISSCRNPDEQQENADKDGLQSNGCASKLQYEDEPLHDLDNFTTGYFPYYRTCEEFFSNSDLPSNIYNTAEIEEVGGNSADQTDSETDYEIGGLYEDIVCYKQSSQSS
ncbi:uncharacterized protein LOC134296160 isoform X2 [Anolis carolinensis]